LEDDLEDLGVFEEEGVFVCAAGFCFAGVLGAEDGAFGVGAFDEGAVLGEISLVGFFEVLVGVDSAG